MFSKYDTTL